MKRNERDVQRAIRDTVSSLGWRMGERTITGTGHLRWEIFGPAGEREVVVAARSPSDWRRTRNLIADIKRRIQRRST